MTPERQLSTRDAAKKLGMSANRITAVKKAMNIRGNNVYPSQIEQYLKAHPDFIQSHYLRASKQADKSSVLNRK